MLEISEVSEDRSKMTVEEILENYPIGTVVKHFKRGEDTPDSSSDKMYMITGYAVNDSNASSGERMVIYKALYSDFGDYVREFTEFFSEVDREKYPDVKQKYRMEKA